MPNSHARRAAVAATLLLALLVVVASSTAAGPQAPTTVTAARNTSTQLISQAVGGGLPNGPSTNAVISNDKRYARVIAFESDASDLVAGDDNGQKDVFAVLRRGGNNKGAPWHPRKTILISRARGSGGANGPSYAAYVDGSFRTRPTCVAFLSQASNLVKGDNNGQPDAFVRKLRKARPILVSKPGKSGQPTTAVAVSGDCRLVAFVTGGKLYVARVGGRAKHIKTRGAAGNPSFSTGLRRDLVFDARGGVYLSKNGFGHPRLVGRGGKNPVYNDIKRRTVAYEKQKGGHTQIAYHDLGKRERIISSNNGRLGNGDSRTAIIGNSGFYVTFDTDATNLGTDPAKNTNDTNSAPDVYLYSDTRKITLLESLTSDDKQTPGGGQNASMSFYANYVVFDSPGRFEQGQGNRQIFLRYLGGI